ncbi:MAG: TIGR02302 family protein [Alphaproteobacteria bacterium]|nr:TIGR02302 family protein [Alphaproteobacteria bacterium]
MSRRVRSTPITALRALGRPLRRAIGAARAALFWERVWPALVPALGAIGLFVAVALLEPWPYFSGWIHLGILVVTVGGVVGLLVRGLRRMTPPDGDQAMRRVERDSTLPHRPLTALTDRLPNGVDATSRGLWRLHQERMAAALRQVRVRMPEPHMARRDPFAFRLVVVLALVVGVAAAGDQAPARLARALLPDLTPRGDAAPYAQLWLKPPAYTGVAPIFASTETPAMVLTAPAGSTLLAQVSGGRGDAALDVDGHATAFQRIDTRNQQLTTELKAGEILTVRQGSIVLGRWPLVLVPDSPPSIAFAAPPARTQRSALRIEYVAADDYGLEGVSGQMRLAGRPELAPQDLRLGLPRPRVRKAREITFHDLTPHPWAGLAVTLILQASDSAGQTGTSETVTVVLPEREFNHPVARAIIEQRRRLITAPSERRQVSRVLRGLARSPGAFDHDKSVFLNLVSAAARLMHDDNDAALGKVVTQLWETALRVEDGKLSLTERDLRDAQQALQDALSRNAPDQEIERLIEELRAALDRFLNALLEQVQRQSADAPRIDPSQLAQMMGRRDLQQIIDQARELARTGARDAARQLLAQLQQLLENLRLGQMPQQMSRMAGQAGEMMNQMRDMIRRQQQLLDQSFRGAQTGDPMAQGQQGPRGQRGQRGEGNMPQPPGGFDGGFLAGEQKALRRQLGELMRQLGELDLDIPGEMGRAEREMRDAGMPLTQNDPSGAIGPQTRALDALRQAAQSVLEALQQRMGEFGAAMGDVQHGSRFSGRRDPLGRPMPQEGYYSGDETKVPDEAEMQKTREILKELYRRAGQRFRPQMERDYIERLLERF